MWSEQLTVQYNSANCEQTVRAHSNTTYVYMYIDWFWGLITECAQATHFNTKHQQKKLNKKTEQLWK